MVQRKANISENDMADLLTKDLFYNNGGLYLFGDVECRMAQFVASQMPTIKDEFKLNSHQQVLRVCINSYGGCFEDGLSIITSLVNSGLPLVTEVTGGASSMAAIIFLSGEVRRISEYGTIMFHEVRWGMDAKLREHEDTAKATKEHYNRILTMLHKRAEVKMRVQDFIEKVSRGEWYLTPKEAKKLNIATEIF